MDSDGEDRPSELKRLIDTAVSSPGLATIAQRTKRSESLTFRALYRVYTALFRVLTSHSINFGNFCVLPFESLDQVVSRPDVWNNFAATIIRARLPLSFVPTTRGRRFEGQSKMNFLNLILHGIGAMSVFSDIVFMRILLASCSVFLAVTLTILFVVWLRLFTELAIPGWTTNILGFLVLIALNSVMLTVMMAFLQLNSRASVQPAPRDYAMSFVRDIRTFASDA